jgi:hypothetical protein
MKNQDKDETSINGRDIIDIFGSAIAEKTELKKINAGSPIEPLPEIDVDLISQKEKSVEKPDFKNENNLAELITFANEEAGILKKELKKYISEKLIDNMLLRSLEKMALQSFLFKNSNWNAEGNLRTDGTIDVERVIKNFLNYKNEPEKIEKEIETSLFMLVSFRLKAIKAVFEKNKYDVFLTDFIKEKNVIEQGYKKSVTAFFNKKVFDRAINGDEQS